MADPSEVPLLKAIVTSLGGVPVGQTEVPLLRQILELLDNGSSGGGGTPGGTAGQVQYNNAGAFGGISEGTAAQVLTSNGAGAAPSFQDPYSAPFSIIEFETGTTIFSPQNGAVHLDGDGVESKIVFGENEGEITLKGTSGALTVRNNNDTADAPFHAAAITGTGSVSCVGSLLIDGTQVVTAQQPILADASEDLTSVYNTLNALLATLRVHGLIAT